MYVLFTAMEEYVSNALLETLLSSSSTTEMLSNLVLKMQDDTQEEWYIEGFEDYDNSEALVDIPLSKEGEDIILYIEWDPVQNEGDLPTEGTIVGYDNSFSEAVGAILDSKGMGKL